MLSQPIQSSSDATAVHRPTAVPSKLPPVYAACGQARLGVSLETRSTPRLEAPPEWADTHQEGHEHIRIGTGNFQQAVRFLWCLWYRGKFGTAELAFSARAPNQTSREDRTRFPNPTGSKSAMCSIFPVPMRSVSLFL